MAFMGDNHLDYPNGRTLKISGNSAEKVLKARDYVEKEYVLANWDVSLGIYSILLFGWKAENSGPKN